MAVFFVLLLYFFGFGFYTTVSVLDLPGKSLSCYNVFCFMLLSHNTTQHTSPHHLAPLRGSRDWGRSKKKKTSAQAKKEGKATALLQTLCIVICLISPAWLRKLLLFLDRTHAWCRRWAPARIDSERGHGTVGFPHGSRGVGGSLWWRGLGLGREYMLFFPWGEIGVSFALLFALLLLRVCVCVTISSPSYLSAPSLSRGRGGGVGRYC